MVVRNGREMRHQSALPGQICLAAPTTPVTVAQGRSDGKWVMIRCATKGGVLLSTEVGGTTWLIDNETIVLRLQLNEVVLAQHSGGNQDALIEVWESTLGLFANTKT